MTHGSFPTRSRLYPSIPPRAGGPHRRRRTPRPFELLLIALVLATSSWAGWRATHPGEPEDVEAPPPSVALDVAPAEAPAGEPAMPLTVVSHTIQRNETLYDALIAMSFTPEEVWSLVKAAKPHVNLSSVRPGTTFSVWRRPDPFAERTLSFQLPIAQNKTLLARPGSDGLYAAEVREIPYETVSVGYTGRVDATLWEAAVDAGMDPNLVADLSDVFAFDIDFNTEVRQGDRFRLVVEQRMLEGKPAGYGRILAAEYMNRGESHAAVLYENQQGELDYFATDGSSLRRMFLRSPLRFRRISSRFSTSRLHPVLKTSRAHQGVDYAADRGTPVRAVGDGVLTAANWNGGSGNFVKIRHNGTYETSYSHLSGYASGVKSGARVKQGQIIGYVGTTGLSTGPHLHFAFYENGRYIDPLGKKFPAAEPVSAKEKARFGEATAKLLPMLPAWPEATAASSTSVGPAVAIPAR